MHTSSLQPFILKLTLAVIALGAVSCAPHITRKPFDDPALQGDINKQRSGDSERGFSYWKDKDAKGVLNVKIDLSEQAAYIFRGDTQVGRSRIATGRQGHSTPTGSFTIIEKTADKRSNLYGQIVDADGDVVKGDADSRLDKVPEGGQFIGASMPNWMRLTNRGIGMHVGPIPNPGSPASHGCIRMPQQMAELLFTHSELGTPVEIVP
ncbi:MAG: lipoprotein-anchoring transpeptidase ErfK/SrfK [Verrucomicrobiales bacterium]|jgi:lipoprotein-anchoring transpeptidase ErfK/SrfK